MKIHKTFKKLKIKVKIEQGFFIPYTLIYYKTKE